MRTPALPLLAAFALAGCLLAACASPLQPPGQGAVTGTVTISPCRPVERAGDPPCPPRPGITVGFQPVGGGSTVTAVTDAGGTYLVRLAPGDYLVRAAGGIAPGPATPVTVIAGSTVTLNLVVDSGIR